MKITATLFEKTYRGERVSIPIADLPPELLTPENNIMINIERGEFAENGWDEGETSVVITHYREQTEEEKKQFKLHLEALKAKRTEERYKEYLKLKKEFETK
jgi:hypothetical protein